jgi:hypothetical protein
MDHGRKAALFFTKKRARNRSKMGSEAYLNRPDLSIGPALAGHLRVGSGAPENSRKKILDGPLPRDYYQTKSK